MEEFITEEQIRDITWEVINRFVIPDFEARGHNASGKWLDSLSVRAEPNKGVISGTEYTQFLIDGRGPNKDQKPEAINNWARWYGSNVFKPWAESKGLSLNPYAVAYSIARTGTKIYKEGGSDFLKVLESEEVKKYVLDRLGIFIKANINNILRDSLIKLKTA